MREELHVDIADAVVAQVKLEEVETRQIETAAAAGIGCIVQPGGSKKDDEVVAAADKSCIPMVFAGVRHFRH